MKRRPEKTPSGIRRRRESGGDKLRTRRLSVRMTERLSSEVASIQGLVRSFGRRETIAELFEAVAMPAIRAHVRGYAQAARLARKARRKG